MVSSQRCNYLALTTHWIYLRHCLTHWKAIYAWSTASGQSEPREKQKKGQQIVYRSTLSNRLPGAPLNSGWQSTNCTCTTHAISFPRFRLRIWLNIQVRVRRYHLQYYLRRIRNTSERFQ